MGVNGTIAALDRGDPTGADLASGMVVYSLVSLNSGLLRTPIMGFEHPVILQEATKRAGSTVTGGSPGIVLTISSVTISGLSDATS